MIPNTGQVPIILKGSIQVGQLLCMMYFFICVVRIDGDNLQMAELIDKLANPATAVLPPLPLLRSFCQVILNKGQLIASDSASENRLDNMPSEGVITSYVGLPLGCSSRTLFGILCHYDFG